MPGNARPRTTMMKRPSYGFGISRDRLLAGESVRTALSRQLYRALQPRHEAILDVPAIGLARSAGAHSQAPVNPAVIVRNEGFLSI